MLPMTMVTTSMCFKMLLRTMMMMSMCFQILLMTVVMTSMRWEQCVDIMSFTEHNRVGSTAHQTKGMTPWG
eukprot:2196216-Pyramimonas_sp.AAC.1